jgi:hypothetical protein
MHRVKQMIEAAFEVIGSSQRVNSILQESGSTRLSLTQAATSSLFFHMTKPHVLSYDQHQNKGRGLA